MISTTFTNMINAINSMFSYATNPLGVILAFAFVFLISGLLFIFILLMVWLISQLWFRPICKFYLWLERKNEYE